MNNETIIKVQNLKKYFPITKGFLVKKHVGDVKAVDDISFEVKKKETFALVGESGCGKTTAARTMLRLIDPTDGKIEIFGQDISNLNRKELLPFRRKMQIVFQNPIGSLNPRMTIGQILTEPLLFHKIVKDKKEAYDKAVEILRMVGLKPYHMDRYPHQFSGGQKQRIAIARALSVGPEIIFLDEPTSALDVSVQAQIINLFLKFQEELDLTYIFISHDLSLVRFISDKVAVMYLGRIVEMGDVDEVFENPIHPYTKALLSASPIPDPKVEKQRKRIILTGNVPNPIARPSGCFFHPRCPFKMEKCEKEYPQMYKISENHQVSCHLVEKEGV
ncbi:oligopeptide transport ATP-binding protein AppF [Thermosipho africanus H17ap60334]|jgi:peptide/nickel transport system ATP-binding protein|uniref:Oligopeptide transport ATP-binding protein AppF n=1 Tax=Thermosipho africanus (strain TCF52B) TaxID=484019 RepID=B7ID94_THEAB|nr:MULTISPECIES: dipeptide ABC transporter ATP-binding protein [Thermosipho]HCF37541.1 dipeptide ABC transporter ATP-binding protein [Thermosipho africanus]ACJ75971.1 oligopeptide transport ATP-binding protein AppF [Thermosipho africanus TCF52B]EKF49628.1 oligopeptide transport ATP-binding protein AppF [Thermosipho africanus H17ap60334]MBZ4650315.1 oligopeptide transport ATP-binding protein AppF [Thermosipho sp. (in: thermotogales)]RDI91722.1 oligopeptide transport ATP-binding protein AppF [Th